MAHRILLSLIKVRDMGVDSTNVPYCVLVLSVCRFFSKFDFGRHVCARGKALPPRAPPFIPRPDNCHIIVNQNVVVNGM